MLESGRFINTQNQRPLVLDDFQPKGFCFQMKLHVYTRSGVFSLSLIRLVHLSVRKNIEKIRMWKDRTLTHFGSTSQFQLYNHNNFLLSDLEGMGFWLITNTEVHLHSRKQDLLVLSSYHYMYYTTQSGAVGLLSLFFVVRHGVLTRQSSFGFKTT